MTLKTYTCLICGKSGKAHGYQSGGRMREHIRAEHPEAEAEIRAFEQMVAEGRKVLREKYGPDFLLMVR